MELTAYEASKKYRISTGYIRSLAGKKTIKGRQAKIKKNIYIWLISEPSLQAYLKTERKPGPKKKT